MIPVICYKFAIGSTTVVVRRESREVAQLNRDELYQTAIQDFGRALDRLAAGYEADPDKRHDLRQEIHLQLWKSLEIFDGRCSLKTWTLRIAHNTAVSYVNRERRLSARFVTLEEVERTAPGNTAEPDIDRHRALQQLTQLILKLKPLDRQIIISYLEEMDTAAIAEITGLSPANIGMKIHRIKNILSRRFLEEQNYV
jgi:RNA polymerase sigma-70 factor (ECF subfamily)